jgi:hypothetical protein
MQLFRSLSLMALVSLAGAILGQTAPFHPPAGYVPPGIKTPPIASQTTKPASPEVAIYRRDPPREDGDLFPIVLEIRNATSASADLVSSFLVEIKSDDGKVHLSGPPIPADSGEKYVAVLRIGIPSVPGMEVPMINGRSLQIPRPNPTGDRARSTDGALSLAIPIGNASLSAIELPGKLLRTGDNTIELQLMQHGKVVATSGVMKVHRD